MNRLKNVLGIPVRWIVGNALEVYAFLLLAVGLPLVAYIYRDWKAALTTFVLTQTAIVILALRSSR